MAQEKAEKCEKEPVRLALLTLNLRRRRQKMTTKKSDNTRGVTLVEVMIAIMIFSIISIGAMSLFWMGRKPAAKAQKMLFAQEFASGAVEMCKTLPYDSAAPSTGLNNPQVSGINRWGVAFTRTYSMREYNANDVVYKIISVTVTWNQGSVTMFSLISPDESF
jgi:prepilin-type N-terminal cleavage/methylation domain-containing protein